MSAYLLAQASHGRRVEQSAHLKLDIEGCVDRGDHPHGGQRVTTEVEEGVIDPDPLQSEYLGIDVGQDLFDGVGRGAVLIAVPVAIFYLALQKYFVSGLTAGSTKG